MTTAIPTKESASRRAAAAAAPEIVAEGEHLVGEFVGDASGPTLLVVGGVHGNEPGGLLALREVARGLESLREKLCGRVYLLAGNTRALRRRVRFIDSDLNRHWTPENLAGTGRRLSEDEELGELLKIFGRVLRTARDEVYALDLHSTSAAGLPFATVGDTLRNRGFARRFPVTILLGIEEQLDGTLLEHLNNAGAVTFGFEGGQHDARETRENHEALAWLALVETGILAERDAPDLERHRRNLAKATGRMRILEVRHREAITPEDEFRMRPGFENFEPVRRGQVLARSRRGEVRAPETGLLLMPLYQKLGADGFFIGREVAPFWLWLSGVLRRRKVGDLMPLLPGVSRHPEDAESLVVDTRIARFFPLQIFHLLGFRKRRWRSNRLVVSRRCHDTESPFKRRGVSAG